jgi:hypothetical protein
LRKRPTALPLSLPRAAEASRGRFFQSMRSGGRVVEGARLESEYTAKPYRGFESLPLRHHHIFTYPPMAANATIICGFLAIFVRQRPLPSAANHTKVWGIMWGRYDGQADGDCG